MKKGFTLIELLAVIVILAIIALIATPIVLGIINDSKNSATIRSAGYYIEAVKHAIMKKNLELQVPIDPKECTVISNSYIKCDEVELEVEVEGELPDSGSITFESGKTINVELIYGERKIVKNSNGELILESNDIQVCKLIEGESNEIGSKYECEVKPGTKYNFYVLSQEEDGTTNLIMERNICSDGTVATEDNLCYVAYNSSGNAADVGPITAMNYLNKATNTWSNIENLNITYNDEGNHFANFKITAKARLPYKSEVHGEGKCLTKFENGNKFGSCPLWLSNYLEPSNFVTGEGLENIDGIGGYWTLSSYMGYSGYAWHVYYLGIVHIDIDVDHESSFGVRPVINLNFE